MNEKILTIKELRAGYGKIEVLKGINLEVNKGEKIVVIGPSGSGKSTLLKCIPMLVKPWSGEIIFNGKKVINEPSSLKEVRTKIGFVFQQYSLFPHMNLLRNVALPLELSKGLNKKDAENIALSILKRLGLGDLAFNYPLELSGGQQQRAAIARALAIDPILLLLDEPTSALDPELRYEVVETLYDIAKQGRSMIIVTHEIDFAEAAADKVIFIEGGVIIEEGDARELLEKPKMIRTEKFLRKLKSPIKWIRKLILIYNLF